MSSTYEEALVMWAAVKYGTEEAIKRVRLDVEHDVYDGCPTCGPEKESTATVTVYGVNDQVVLKDSFVIDWYSGFSDLLKEIIEAGS